MTLNMTPRQALLATADLIEERPGDYNFWVSKLPADGHGPACPLAWVCYFLGLDEKSYDGVQIRNNPYPWLSEAARILGAKGEQDFYNRVRLLARENNIEFDWDNRHSVTKSLRHYAAEYLEGEPKSEPEVDLAAVLLDLAHDIEHGILDYNFTVCRIPQKISDCGCILGWLEFYITGGKPAHEYGLERVVRDRLGLRDSNDFYMCLEENAERRSRLHDRAVAAESLRHYVTKYLAQKQTKRSEMIDLLSNLVFDPIDIMDVYDRVTTESQTESTKSLSDYETEAHRACIAMSLDPDYEVTVPVSKKRWETIAEKLKEQDDG